VNRFACPIVLVSEAFSDGQALLEVAERHKLEGVVNKRRDAPYRSVPAAAGARSRPRPGVRRTGSVGDCLRSLRPTRKWAPQPTQNVVRPIQTSGIGAGTTIRWSSRKHLIGSDCRVTSLPDSGRWDQARSRCQVLQVRFAVAPLQSGLDVAVHFARTPGQPP
jgi:hypothetical protein